MGIEKSVFFFFLASVIIKCCLCFSLILYSHFVGYHLLHIENADFTSGSFSAKFPFGEYSVRRKFCSVKNPSTKIPSAALAGALFSTLSRYYGGRVRFIFGSTLATQECWKLVSWIQMFSKFCVVMLFFFRNLCKPSIGLVLVLCSCKYLIGMLCLLRDYVRFFFVAFVLVLCF